ncbi:endonuclease domain-containing protein [Lewinella sp. IMCC34183]|uniref:endonuclease domain-containing protein n=1 Tax=Lewinella sp. IMCC34183 TaxID=2248762 RepID=UPI000E2690C6|nr:DUF559 domain-containing protein [Lewinella sp. IMCC34183]
MNNLRDFLETKEKFEPLLHHFVSKTIEEEIDDQITTDEVEIEFNQFLKKYFEFFPKFNSDLVFRFAESPIERIFLNSLTLLFVRKAMLGPWYDQPYAKVPRFLNDFRTAHQNILKLETDYVKMTGDDNFDNFEDFKKKQILSGRYTEEDFATFDWHRTVVEVFGWDAFRIVLQPIISNIKINNKQIRSDLLIWKPSDDNFKLIVECDGFKYHSNKSSFENDRARDRILKKNGYDVIRFSGGEIWRDPVSVSVELFEYLESKE